MKKRMLILFIAFLAMALLPFLSVKNGYVKEPSGMSSEPPHQKDTPKNSSGTVSSTFRILDTASEKIVTINDKDFCRGALLYEMPPYFEPEALKAQCIACYTHFCRLREKQKSSPDSELKGADLKADLTKKQYYISDETFKEQCGGLYEEYINKINSVIDDVFGMTLTDENGELIDAAYFALSSGRTENSEDIFGFESPYLKAVPSPYDLTSPDYMTKAVFSEEEAIEKLRTLDPDIKFTGSSKIIAERTGSGSVKTLKIGTSSFSGQDIRELFSLRSTNFTLSFKNNKFIFTVKGYGHGVGMSQYGSNEMAKQGMDFREILRHYYGTAVISSDQS